MIHVQCDVCGLRDKGTKKQLAEKGWRRAIAYPLGKKVVIMRCPNHIEGYDDLIAKYFKNRVKLSTHIGGVTLKGNAKIDGDIVLAQPKHLTGDDPH